MVEVWWWFDDSQGGGARWCQGHCPNRGILEGYLWMCSEGWAGDVQEAMSGEKLSDFP